MTVGAYEWSAFDSPAMTDYLAERLATPLPARLAHRPMAPELAYGRHHGPVACSARQAAVLLLVHGGDGGWSVPAVLRPQHMKSHAGQVSLPGGMVEAGETVEAAALREFEEELGAVPNDIRVLGRLSPVYVFVTDFQVTPLVAISAQPLEFIPSPDEVAEVVELPLQELVDPLRRGSHLFSRQGLTFKAPHFQIGGFQIWGATSLILAEFADLIAGGQRPGC